MREAPVFEARGHSRAARTIAARTWQSLLEQEERSRAFTARLATDLARLDAAPSIVASARRIADDEARHVAICAHLVGALGFAPEVPRVALDALPTSDEGFEVAMAEILVAGFAVGETMSVGGFAAARAIAKEPLARWALAELARDEVRHGAFGEEAGAWILRSWSTARRRALWPACVQMMEAVEARGGGPVAAHSCDRGAPEIEALGAPSARTSSGGLLRAVPRWVLPRLARMGVLPG
jgi:hypothetical protein